MICLMGSSTTRALLYIFHVPSGINHLLGCDFPLADDKCRWKMEKGIIHIMNDLERELHLLIEGDVRFDKYSRLLYSTDASIYQVEPIGVVIPRFERDVQAVLSVANRLNVPVLPRGGGTSLTGQTVNHAIVLDFSAHLNQVIEVNQEEMWARVQPGIIQDELNQHLRPMGLLFCQDTSTSIRETLGGMIGNTYGRANSF